MKNTYQRTNWIDNVTPVNADNLNKIEEAIDELYSGSVGISQLKKGKGVDIKLTDFREVELGINPFEMNEMVEHNKYIEGNGIIMKDTTPPLPPVIPTPDTTIDEWVEDEDKELVNKPPFPPLHPPTEISIDEDYVNDIVKHNKYIGTEGVIVEKIEEEPVEGEEEEELVKDKYSVKADIEYIDKNITHPNYVGIRGIKIRKPVLDQIFPELEIDERTKVAYLDEDYLNDFAIDVQKLAERLNIAPIVEYVAGDGLEIVGNINQEPGNEVHEPAQEGSAEEETPTDSNSETVVTEITPGEDQTMQEAVMEDIINEEIGEPESTVPEKIYKTIRLDEEWLDERLENHDPEFVSDPNTGLSITKAEVDNEVEEGVEPAETTYEIGVDKSKLQEYLEVKDTPNIRGAEYSGITVNHSQPEASDPYTPTIDTFTIGVDPEELRVTLNVKENPVLTTENGITLTITETPSQDYQESVENWKIGLDTDYVNSIVKHKYYTFRSPFFTYKDIDADHGEISFNEAYFTTKVTEIVNQILRSKGL